MSIYESVRAVTAASGEGDGAVDWDAVGRAATAATDAGVLDLTDRDRSGYATDVRVARDRVRSVGGLAFDLPETIEIQNRHHWIDANVGTFRRVMRPLEGEKFVPGVARVINTGSMAFALTVLANNVLGQYDPLLLADDDDHALYFVHPNIRRVAGELDIGFDRFRRWIAFHEVTHAAEFGAAPWLSEYLESKLEETVAALRRGRFDQWRLGELDTAMTAVEGYAELLMDRAFDGDSDDVRAEIDRRRRGRGPVARLLWRLLGLDVKRRQYERGKAFFEAVADERGVAGTGAVWDRPENLPTDAELDDPAAWISRIDP